MNKWPFERTNGDVLKAIDEKQTLLDTLKRKRWQILGLTLRAWG